jgi:hypothetical protein
MELSLEPLSFRRRSLGVTLAGLKLHVEFAGTPEQLSCNVWLKPRAGVIVRTALPNPPCLIVMEAGFALIEKSGAMTGSAVRPIAPETLAL